MDDLFQPVELQIYQEKDPYLKMAVKWKRKVIDQLDKRFHATHLLLIRIGPSAIQKKDSSAKEQDGKERSTAGSVGVTCAWPRPGKRFENALLGQLQERRKDSCRKCAVYAMD